MQKYDDLNLNSHHTGDRIFDILNILFMLLLSVTMVYPFLNLAAISLNDGKDAAMGGIYLLPRKFTLENYGYVLDNKKLLNGFIISVARTVIGAGITVLCTGLLAYIVSLKNFSGRRFMRTLFLITMYFSGGLIPTYLLITKLGLTNTFHVYWIPAILNSYYMLIMASFIQELPDSIIESAKLDGAGEIRTYFSIIIPLSVPVYAAIALYAAVGQWNSWFDTALYNTNGAWDTLQIVLRRILLESEAMQEITDSKVLYQKYQNITSKTLRSAITIFVTLPIIMIYPFLQRYFVGGLTIGGVKA